MKFKVGVIGAKKSVEKIIEVGKSFENMSLLAFPFNNETQINNILENNKPDMWLFSGPFPYSLAKKYLKQTTNATYCKSIGAGFYSQYIQISKDCNKLQPRISIDSDRISNIDEILMDSELILDDIYIKNYDILDYDLEELANFHIELYKSGKTDVALTPILSLADLLNEKGIKAYHLRLTKQEIFNTLKLLEQVAETTYFKTTQVGLVILEIDNYNELVQKVVSQYALNLMEWKIEGKMLQVCKVLNGSLTKKGSGVYEIFSSRGITLENIDTIFEVIKEAEIILNFSFFIHIGIGFGESFSSAQFNAYKALRNTTNENKVVIIGDEGQIVEDVYLENNISYISQTDDIKLLEKLHSASVSIKTYKKIHAIVDKLKSPTFSVIQIANALGVSEQNIRRIITSLHKNDLVEIAGEKSLRSKGRPTKLYKFV